MTNVDSENHCVISVSAYCALCNDRKLLDSRERCFSLNRYRSFLFNENVIVRT